MMGRNEGVSSLGEPIIGRETGAAYLIPGKNHYTHFKIVACQPPNSDEPPLPEYQPIYERPLTDEEIAHLRRLAAKLDSNP